MDIRTYISGFVDGEGCFCISFSPSNRHRLGWEIRPSFSVSQNEDRAQLLHMILELWKCGNIRPDRSDSTLKFEVRRIGELNSVVIPHFREYPMLSAKQHDFECFDQVCQLLQNKEHLRLDGLSQIVRIAAKMNASGKRKYSCDEILNSLRRDEGIVYAPGNRGIT